MLPWSGICSIVSFSNSVLPVEVIARHSASSVGNPRDCYQLNMTKQRGCLEVTQQIVTN